MKFVRSDAGNEPIPGLIIGDQLIDLPGGDLLATGTPEGVGVGMTPPTFLKPGDVVRCEIDQVGAIENKVMSREG